MILQAIGASHRNTLEGRQGFGMVKCSRSMPKALQELALRWEYPNTNDKEPVFTLRDISEGDTRWALLNRTVPAPGLTGRTGSQVSHTLAIRHDDIFEYFRSYPGKGITPFELMLCYPWEEKWTGEPAYIEDADNLKLADVIAKTRQFPPAPGPLPPGEVTARAFDGKTLETKKTSWETAHFKSRDLLDIFHQAWMAIDPWRGENLYPDIPDGDNPGTNMLHLSWACTFTTQPRGDRPDYYCWFTGPTPKRPVINLATLGIPSGQASLVRELGGPHAEAIIARAANPTEWAEEKTRDIKRDNEAKDRQEKRQRQQRIAQQIEAEKARKKKNAGSGVKIATYKPEDVITPVKSYPPKETEKQPGPVLQLDHEGKPLPPAAVQFDHEGKPLPPAAVQFDHEGKPLPPVAVQFDHEGKPLPPVAKLKRLHDNKVPDYRTNSDSDESQPGKKQSLAERVSALETRLNNLIIQLEEK